MIFWNCSRNTCFSASNRALFAGQLVGALGELLHQLACGGGKQAYRASVRQVTFKALAFFGTLSPLLPFHPGDGERDLQLRWRRRYNVDKKSIE